MSFQQLSFRPIALEVSGGVHAIGRDLTGDRAPDRPSWVMAAKRVIMTPAPSAEDREPATIPEDRDPVVPEGPLSKNGESRRESANRNLPECV